jgi:membrane-associated protease RseP (regulator of RpoE activity)
MIAAATILLGTVEAAAAWPDQRSYLGVHIDQVTPQTVSALKLPDASGALITYVDQDGPAGRAGLKNNDVVVGFNGSKVQSPDQLQEMIHATAAGKTVNLALVRDGQKKNINVTLGAWPTAVAHTQGFAAPLPPVAFSGPAMASPAIPDIEIPSFVALASRHGLVVESLCPQLSDYFGVPKGQGVLVRSVEKGSPAEAAGLKAGDVIVKVNNEPVHDMADWRRAMRGRAGRIPIAVVREKHEQTVVMSVASSGDTSRLQDQDWSDFAGQMQAFQQEMENLGPEIERNKNQMLATIKPSQQELEQMRDDIQRSMKLKQMDIEKMQHDLAQSMPSQQQLDEMRRNIEESMKSWTPQFQQEMERFKKQMEDHKLDLQQLMKGFETEPEF